MSKIFDVAQYIIDRLGPMSSMRLQKLVYLSQCESLARSKNTLFQNSIKAWAHSPVVEELYNAHKDFSEVDSLSFSHLSSNTLNKEQKDLLNRVIETYGDKSSQWLIDQIRSTRPWQIAREGIPDSERGDVEITPSSIIKYYYLLCTLDEKAKNRTEKIKNSR